MRSRSRCLVAVLLALAGLPGLAGCPAPTVPPADATDARAEGSAVLDRAPEPPATPRLAGRVGVLHDAMDPARLMATVTLADRYFRARGNEGYEATLTHVMAGLRDAGFGADARALPLGPEEPTWNVRSGHAEIVLPDQEDTVLFAFAEEGGAERTAALVGSAPVAAKVFDVLPVAADEVAGRVVFGDMQECAAAIRDRGAVGMLVPSDLADFQRPREEPDTIAFGQLPDGLPAEAFGFTLSPASAERLRLELLAATTQGTRALPEPVPVRIALEVTRGRGHATTVEARLRGRDPEAGEVVFFAHADEPGAVDNASGVAALLELAVALRGAVEAGTVAPPDADIVFLWGQEMESSRRWLEARPRDAAPIRAGLVFDMVGASPATVGAPFLIERMPDPGAVWTRAPDAHTEWGAGSVDQASLRGHYLDDLARAAARAGAATFHGFVFRDHPFEGGSDHESFLRRGLPAVLAWHFTDDAYHTSRDRLARVDPERARQVAAVMGALALSLASDDVPDRREALAVTEQAALERLAFARAAAREALRGGADRRRERSILDAWRRWFDQALASLASEGDDPLAADLEAARERVDEAYRTPF